jgi:hypothetical protein
MKNLKTRLVLCSLVLATVPALGQTIVNPPPVGPPVTPGPIVPGPVLVVPLPLTPAGAEYARSRLQGYVSQRGAQLPSRSALIAAGLSIEADAVERGWLENGRWVAPHHISRAAAVPPPSRTTDPAAEEGARAAARIRLGRAPTAADVATDLGAFDARVAAINQQLVNHRSDIATALRTTGKFPRELEDGWLGVTPREQQARSPDATTRANLRRVLTALFNGLAPPPALPLAPVTGPGTPIIITP